eukprot:jgi/Botrbrau1/10632/Bobra.154_1s0021.1
MHSPQNENVVGGPGFTMIHTVPTGRKVMVHLPTTFTWYLSLNQYRDVRRNVHCRVHTQTRTPAPAPAQKCTSHSLRSFKANLRINADVHMNLKRKLVFMSRCNVSRGEHSALCVRRPKNLRPVDGPANFGDSPVVQVKLKWAIRMYSNCPGGDG